MTRFTIRKAVINVMPPNRFERGNIPITGYKDTYITKELRAKLEEKDIYAETIIQCEGDGVFIPQGAIHQVIFSNNLQFPTGFVRSDVKLCFRY